LSKEMKKREKENLLKMMTRIWKERHRRVLSINHFKSLELRDIRRPMND
jgi:hypothetical protein